MFRFLLCFLVSLGLTGGQLMAQSFSINGPLIADGGICTPFDTASFTATITINSYQNQTWYMDFDFGDGSLDTFAFVTNNVNGTYIFRGSHVYQSTGTFPIKVYARDNANNIRDSILSTVTIGNCQKASGMVYHDYVQNCTKEPSEAPMASQYYRFYRDGVLEHVYLDKDGRFKIPIYTGDTIQPQSGMIAYFSTFATPCGGSAFPLITGAVSNYNIALRPMGGDSYQLTSFCNGVDTMICIGTGFVTMPYGFATTNKWYVRVDYGNGYFPTNYYSIINQYSGTSTRGTSYNTPGIYTAKIHLYDQYQYGPVMTMEKTFSVSVCHPVKVDVYSDNNSNCELDSAEFRYDMNIGNVLNMHSVLRNDNNPYIQNTDGSITAFIWPGDTVYRANSLGFYFAGSPANYPFYDIQGTACGPQYITEAIDSTAFAFKGAIEITGFGKTATWGNCIGDSLYFSMSAVSLGLAQGDTLRLRCIYSDGITDTIQITPPVIDTFSLVFGRKILAMGSLDYTFILEKPNGTVTDTLSGSHQVFGCAAVILRAFYDENRNCIKDTNEVHVKNFSMQNTNLSGTFMEMDSITLRLSIAYATNLERVFLSAGSQLGKGYYSRAYTAPICGWPSFTVDTASFEVPLVDTVRVDNPILLNFISVFSEIPNIPACDSVYHPILRGSIYGNRNAAYPPYFVYHNGNGAVDTAVVTPLDDYTDVEAVYRATAPNSTYPYGSYVPGYEVRNAHDSLLLQYVKNPALQVTHNCETPKAKLFIDTDANCVKNTADPALNNIAVAVTVNGQAVNAVTDNNGNVFFNAANGSLVSITVPQTLSTGQVLSAACVSSNAISYTYTTGSATNNFPYSCTGTANDYSILAGHNYWTAGGTDTIYLYPQHTGCGTGSGILSLALDPGLNFVASSRPGQIVSGQTISWNISNMAALGATPVKVAVNLNGTVTGGSLCNTAALMPSIPDANPANNTFVLCDSISGVVPSLLKTGIADSIYAQPGQPVVYTIHFQNTTPAAVSQVVILDTISPLLNINSLSVLNASHVYNTVILNNNVLKFTFPAIQLQAGSTGMIRFALNAVASLAPGTVITNRAAVMYNYQPFSFTNMAMAFNMPGVPLQSGLRDISARHIAGGNIIDWVMGDVYEGSYFELEKSGDGQSFTYLDRIPAGKQKNTYQYKDLAPLTGINFYRLKLFSIDGRFSYSPVVTASWNPKDDFGLQAYPNPVRHALTLKVSGTLGNDPFITICDLGGRTLSRTRFKGNETTISMEGWANGVYLIRYTDALRTETLKINKE